MRARYGLDRPRRGTRVLAVIVVLAFVGALAYVGWNLAHPSVSGRLITWTVAAPDRVDLTFDINVPRATCVLRAQDDQHIDVGYASVEATGRTDYRLHTLAPAYVVEILGCSADGAPQVIPPQFPPGVVPPVQPAP